MPHQNRATERDSHASRRRQEAERTDGLPPAAPVRAVEDQLEEMQRVNPDDHVSSK